jgi:hypothetical protein
MSKINSALEYTRRGWPVFPMRALRDGRKVPCNEHGFREATLDPVRIEAWWARWPDALIAIATGTVSGIVVLDIDVKHDGSNGYDALAELGQSILPDTPLSFTPSGGLHILFSTDRIIPTTTGRIGRSPEAKPDLRTGRYPSTGLDVRAELSCAIMPTPGTKYHWDPLHGIDEPLAPAPEWLVPPEEPRKPAEPVERADGLSPYGERAVLSACNNIARAANGHQAVTLNSETYSIGTLAGSGAVPADWALRMLHRAALDMPSYNSHDRWRPREIESRVKKAFEDGMRKPRPVLEDRRRRHG